MHKILLSSLEACSPSHQILYSVHILNNSSAIYIENPKCGCSYIKLNLAQSESREFYDPLFVHDRGQLPTGLAHISDNGYLLLPQTNIVFSSVRDPVSRILSCYLNKIDNSSDLKYVSYERLRLCEYAGISIDRHISFMDFLTIISSQAPHEMNPHWRTQYHQLLFPHVFYTHLIPLACLSQQLPILLDLIYCNQRNRLFSDFHAINTFHSTNANNLINNYVEYSHLKLIKRIYECDYDEFAYLFNNLGKGK